LHPEEAEVGEGGEDGNPSLHVVEASVLGIRENVLRVDDVDVGEVRVSVVPAEAWLKTVSDDVRETPGGERDGEKHVEGGEGDESNEPRRVETSS